MVMGLRIASGLSLVLLSAGTLTSCASDDPSDREPSSGPGTVAAEQVSGDTFVLLDSSTLGLDARVSGKVSLVGDCLGIDNTVVLWPAMTQVVSQDPLVVELPNAGRVRVGDTVQGAGGRVDAATHGEGVEVPNSCGTGRVMTFRAE
jgi:hypothetical protein